MKKLKPTDKIVLTLELTVEQADALKDLIHEAASGYVNRTQFIGMGWEYPATVSFSSFADDTGNLSFWKKCQDGAMILYQSLRESLRMKPLRREKFDEFFEVGYEGDRVKLFKEWLDDLRVNYGTPPRMDCERHELSSIIECIEIATRVAEPGTGALPIESGWYWNHQDFSTWADLETALVNHYKANREFWDDQRELDRTHYPNLQKIIDKITEFQIRRVH